MSNPDNLMAIEEELDTHDRATVAYDDETILWQGKPSQWVNLGTFLWWSIILVGALVFKALWGAGLSEEYTEIVVSVIGWASLTLITISVLSILHAYLSVRYEHTTITMNKIKEAKGITSIFREEKLCELSDVNDFKSPPAGILGLLGLSTLVMETNDSDQPIIKIRAIKDREELINRILPIQRKLKIERKGYFGDRG
ncbi:YdbT family protein [Alkalimarinus alittae]|uniref:DUF304 domain-containing protein n=1 Tax=Alkalimarinus alittae TaxID=2961619 RepID=A0ABY6N590_9ALTE|nr:hypothetical protein [Alkalimarinus alittae]UZE97281.1 hypothetical protein NKI27_05890 [Alkalimarinus alittae]